MQNGTKLIMDDLFREQMLKNVSLDDFAIFIMVSGQDWNKQIFAKPFNLHQGELWPGECWKYYGDKKASAIFVLSMTVK